MSGRGLRWRQNVSSLVMHLDLLLKLPPDEVLFDFLAQCGLTLHAVDDASDGNVYEKLRIAIAIELAPEPIRDAVVASLRDVALLADAEGLVALRTVSKRAPGRVNPLHLADAPAQCALWMYLRHRDLFDAALRLRGLRAEFRAPLSLEPVRAPLAAPDDLVVNSVRLCEATLLDETTGGEIAVRAPACIRASACWTCSARGCRSRTRCSRTASASSRRRSVSSSTPSPVSRVVDPSR